MSPKNDLSVDYSNDDESSDPDISVRRLMPFLQYRITFIFLRLSVKNSLVLSLVKTPHSRVLNSRNTVSNDETI